MKRLLLLTAAILALSPSASHAAPLVNATGLPSGGVINYNICCDTSLFLETGDFITLYDAGATPINLAGDMANSSLFTITEDLTDPGYLGETPPDNSAITNIRFTYIGTANLTDSNLGTFSLLDPSNTFRVVAEDGEAHSSVGYADSTSSEIAPALVSATPEPSSFALLGTGLLGAFGVARRRFAS